MKLSINKRETPNEDGPVMLQLQRRHTLAEVDNNIDNTTETAHSNASRSNSVSDADTTQNSSQVTTEFQPKGTADGTLSPEGNQTSLSTASTVVITESELSSSWLYKNKKAQMNMASPCDSICESSESNVEEPPVEDKSPMISRPIKDAKGITHKSKSGSTCCCYATALCIIFLATLGILAAIAGIIYIEIFSTKSSENGKTNNSESESNFTDDRELLIHDLIPMQKIGYLLDQENETVLKDIPTSELIFPITAVESLNEKNSYKENDNELEIKSEISKQSKGNKRINNETVDKDADAMLISIIANETNSLEESISDTDDETSHVNRLFEVMKSNVSQILNLPNKESPYSKLFQLYNELYNTESKNLTALEEISDSSVQNSSKMRNLDLSINNSDFNEQKIIENKSEDEIQKNGFDFAVDHELGIEKNKADDLTTNSAKSLPFNDHVLEEKNKSLPHLEQDRTDELELSVTQTLPHKKLHEEEDVFTALENNSAEEQGKEDIEQLFSKSLPQSVIEIEEDVDSSLKNNTENEQNSTDLDVHEIKSVPNQNEDLDDFKQLKDRKNEKDIQEQNLSSTTLTKPLNQPIVETNIAVPGPVELFRRLMRERESFKPIVRQDEHDRKFSLAKALESLRNLDVNNQLPSSRQRPSFKRTESPKWNMPRKVQTQDQNEERGHYLENLRKILYENE